MACLPRLATSWLESLDGEVICTLRLMEEHAGGEKAFRLGWLCTQRGVCGRVQATRLLCTALAEVGDYPCPWLRPASGLAKWL